MIFRFTHSPIHRFTLFSHSPSFPIHPFTDSPIHPLFRLVFMVLLSVISPSMSQAKALPPVPHEVAREAFELGDKKYVLTLVPEKGIELGEGEEGSGYCGNPDASPEISSDFDLVLSRDQDELSRLSLGECRFVYRDEKWLVRGIPPLRLLKRNGKYPLIIVSQYGGCNGNMNYLFWFDIQNEQPVLKAIRILSFPYALGNNELWSDPTEESIKLLLSPRTHKYEIWTKGYDNAGLFSFIAQYGEISPGQWECIGLYTEAGGAYETMKRRIFGK